MSEKGTTYRELKELMVLDQFISVAKKELVHLLSEIRLNCLKEAATWADNPVLAHCGAGYQGSAGSSMKGGVRWSGNSSGSGPSSQPRYSMSLDEFGTGPVHPRSPPLGSGEGLLVFSSLALKNIIINPRVITVKLLDISSSVALN